MQVKRPNLSALFEEDHSRKVVIDPSQRAAAPCHRFNSLEPCVDDPEFPMRLRIAGRVHMPTLLCGYQMHGPIESIATSAACDVRIGNVDWLSPRGKRPIATRA